VLNFCTIFGFISNGFKSDQYYQPKSSQVKPESSGTTPPKVGRTIEG